MNCIILGDKYYKGMKSKGCAALISHKSSTILDGQYQILKQKFRPDNIIYVYGFDSKRFLTYITKNNYLELVTVFNEEYEKKNSGHSLSLVKDFLNDDTIIIDGYKIISKTMLKNLDTKKSSILVSSQSDNSLGCVVNDSVIENIGYDLDNKLCNIFYLTKLASHSLKAKLSTNKYHNAFLFEIFNDMIDEGIQLICHRI